MDSDIPKDDPAATPPPSAPAGDGEEPKKTEEDEGSVQYHVGAVDGSETEITLSRTASVYDAFGAVGAWKGLTLGRFRLIVQGHEHPLTCSRSTRLWAVAGGVTELLVVICSGYQLGAGEGPLAPCCTPVQFEHYPVAAYAAAAVDGDVGGEVELEVCDGQRVDYDVATSGPEPGAGVMFHSLGPEDSSATPGASNAMSGRMLMRVVIHNRRHCLGIGAGCEGVNLKIDPEHDSCFLGLYHGGYSTNVCAYARRTHTGSGSRDRNEWRDDAKLAIVFDFAHGSMQCYEGLQKFGSEVRIKDAGVTSFWPVVTTWRQNDPASIASIAVDFL